MQHQPIAIRLLRKWCRDKGLEEQELAEKIGIHKAQLSAYFNGHRRPSLSRALDIERITRVPAHAWDIVDGEETAERRLAKLSKATVAFWSAATT